MQDTGRHVATLEHYVEEGGRLDAKAVVFVSAPLQLSFSSQIEKVSIQTIGALLTAGCRTKADVQGLSQELATALPTDTAPDRSRCAESHPDSEHARYTRRQHPKTPPTTPPIGCQSATA